MHLQQDIMIKIQHKYSLKINIYTLIIITTRYENYEKTTTQREKQFTTEKT